MSSLLLEGPAAEPITLADAKAFIRVEHNDDDDVIAALIAGSRIHVESRTHRALVTQTWRTVRDCWPASGRLSLLPAPLISLVAARVYRADGTTQTIDLSAFTVDVAAATIAFATPPAPERPLGGIEIDFTAGYGDPEDVPEPLRHAIRLLVAHWYENRGIVAASGEVAVMPQGVAALIAPYRVLGL